MCVQLASATEDAICGQLLGALRVRTIAEGGPQNYAQAGRSAESGKKLEEIWQAGQREMLSISTDSGLIVAKKSGNLVIYDEPDLVIEMICGLLEQVRGGGLKASKIVTRLY
ncbi:hypothetical protein ABEX25_03350 [Paenibacillus thiaminolyticus]|uniref:hypothetical protein n=1 Tax=Paenibacillus thiaminolyticus TaxID=49283 RepID=UPI003D2D2D5D